MQNGAYQPTSSAQWLAEIERQARAGERLRAVDIAETALHEVAGSWTIKHALVLALARAGATQQAMTRFRQLRLDEMPELGAQGALELDIASLDARLAKDAALSAPGPERGALLRTAAARYNDVFDASGDRYPGINAATLWFLAGEVAKSRQLAGLVLAACRHERDRRGGSYYLAATEAEAHLLLGERGAARAALRAASSLADDLSALATTRKQLAAICAAAGSGRDVLDALLVPAVAHYTGHTIGPRFAAERERAVVREIAAALDRHDVRIGYGSLAGGADILLAEALLRRGGEVHVVLPFGADEFKLVSVAPSGAQWLERFDACLAKAESVSFATTDDFLGDTTLLSYASQMAMGLALLRGDYLGGPVRQIAVWDGVEANGGTGAAGTFADIQFWASRGLETDIVSPRADPEAAVSVGAGADEVERPPQVPGAPRVVRAILFGDFKGFSGLREAQLPVFQREILQRFATVLDRYGGRVLFRNSWGDGLFVVAEDAETAANCALDLQLTMRTIEPERLGFPEQMGLRLGAHIGPVYELFDPIIRQPAFTGVHVSLAARVEPVAPTGAVYVTEAFAANLATLRGSPFVCEYVGQVDAAKGYGKMRMYSLRRATTSVC